jgi:hypothetical protein
MRPLLSMARSVWETAQPVEPHQWLVRCVAIMRRAMTITKTRKAQAAFATWAFSSIS